MTDSDGETVYRKTGDFLAENPDCESELETLLDVDSSNETWAFDDIPLDSGRFGEIVSRGIVTKHDGEYRVTDADAVRAALSGEEHLESEDTTDATETRKPFDFGFSLDYQVLVSLLSALLIVVATRLFYYRSVFYRGRVVSPGNDPYFFRYWQEQLLADSSGPLSFSVLVNPPWDDGSFNQRPLTHATNWWFSELLGGGQWGADMVAAWLPLVFTLLLALVIYYLALVLTDDIRVGFASVLVLALAPVHANYTGLGLLHHRYNQYLWFGVILLTLVWLATDLKTRHSSVGPEQAVRDHIRQRKTWVFATAFGLAFAFWTHSWGGSLELFAPLVIYLGLRICLDVREGLSPGRANLPIVFGFGIGATVAMALHLALGWQGIPAPALALGTFVGVAVVVGLGEVWHRQQLSARKLLATQAAIVAVGAVAVSAVLAARTDVIARIVSETMPSSAPAWQTSVQSESLYSTELFVVFGPVTQIGFEFYIALAALIWCLGLVYRAYEPGWLLLTVVTLHYLVLSGIMVRFAGRLVIVMAVLGGVGIVSTLAWLDLIEIPHSLADSGVSSGETVGPNTDSDSRSVTFPDVRRTVMIVVVCLLIFGPSLVFLPTLMSQVTHDSGHTEAAMDIADHAESVDREYPTNHVLAPWSEYRLYNYFVSGESESERLGRYGYPRFVQAENPEADQFRNQAGYVVLSQDLVDISADDTHDRLSDHLGLPGERFESLAHYRLILVDEQDDIAVFAVVPGATLEIDGTEDEQVHIATEVTVSDRTFTYERTVNVDSGEMTMVTVPYPGTYDVDGTTVSVDEQDIENNERIVVD